MHSDGIRNDLEPQKKENQDGKWCIRTVFETIWNRRKKKTRMVKGAFGRYLKRFGTAEKKKKRMVNGAF